MRRPGRGLRIASTALSILATAGVAAWAVAHSTARLAPVVGLAGTAGVVTFAIALTEPFRASRNRAMSTGLVLVATSVVVCATGSAAPARTGFLVVAGAILFCAAEFADRALANARKTEHRRGVDRWSATWVIGVASGSAGLSYGAISARGLLVGGGPAALVAGVAAATLVAFLVVLVLRSRPSTGP
jgi:hypothetical protein